jgi:hypothetical protein
VILADPRMPPHTPHISDKKRELVTCDVVLLKDDAKGTELLIENVEA